MTAISVRLPEALARQLDAEVALSGRPRSAVIREAIARLLLEQERQRARQAAAVASAAHNLAQDPAAMAEARALAEAFLEAENEALDIAEGRDPAAPWAEADGKWWR